MASLTIERSESEIANKCDDWNMDLVEPERNRLEVITSRSETPKLNEQIGVKTETEDITDKLNKELMKRKSALIKVKSIKRNKICPNLNMARNKVSGKENKDSTNVQTTDNANNSLIVALHENNALRIEIENLKKTIERYQRGQDSIPQVTVQNRFMALDTEIPSQMEAEETEQQDKDFVTILRRKNSQDNNGNKKKEKAENNNTIKDQHIASTSQERSTTQQKLPRKDKPPPPHQYPIPGPKGHNQTTGNKRKRNR